MRALGISAVLVLPFVLFTLGLPAAASTRLPRTRLPRTQFCGNDPKTRAGTFLPARDLAHSSLEVRGPDTMLWCAPNSRTYVVITLVQNVAQTGIMYLLKNAAEDLQARIGQHGDGLVPGGVYIFDLRTGKYDCQLYCANSNNHQQTWSIVNSAIGAVWGYMLENNNIGTAMFTIYDGGNEVGRGTVDAVKM